MIPCWGRSKQRDIVTKVHQVQDLRIYIFFNKIKFIRTNKCSIALFTSTASFTGRVMWIHGPKQLQLLLRVCVCVIAFYCMNAVFSSEHI